MKIIKLSATSSTNSYLKKLAKEIIQTDTIVVTTKEQTKGRGQQGETWISNKGESLTFSMFFPFENLPARYQFQLSIQVSISIKKALDFFGFEAITIKWPNDIMSYQKKIGGILIENQLEGAFIKSSIIGIGINCNETAFTNLPNASSLYLQYGTAVNIDMLFEKICSNLDADLKKFNPDIDFKEIEIYESFMFRINKVSVFETPVGSKWNGIIKGVTQTGKLKVKTENEMREFDLKEIKMHY